MSSERYSDTDLVFWFGRSINAMTREELQVALGEAIMQIENLKNWRDNYKNCAEVRKDMILGLAKELQEYESRTHSRFTNPDYIASFC